VGIATGHLVDVIDIDDAPAYGRIIVARATVEDWGQTFGMLPAEASARLQGELGELRVRVAAQDEVIANLRQAIISMHQAGFSVPLQYVFPAEKEPEMDKPTPTELENIAANAALDVDMEIRPPSEADLAAPEVPASDGDKVAALQDADVGRRFTWAALEDPDDKDHPYTAVLVSLARDADGAVESGSFMLDSDGSLVDVAADEKIWFVVDPDAPAVEDVPAP
jgi:hypothetical protein